MHHGVPVALVNIEPLGSRIVVGKSKEVSMILRSSPHRSASQAIQ
jgi:hypothetical protein